MKSTQQQTGGSDCGLYAIAFLTDVLIGKISESHKYF